jgi:hypothetical protein
MRGGSCSRGGLEREGVLAPQGGIHGKVYGVRGETVEEVWPVDARGKLQ